MGLLGHALLTARFGKLSISLLGQGDSRSRAGQWLGEISNLLKETGLAQMHNVGMSILPADQAAIGVALRRRMIRLRSRELRLELQLLKSQKDCSLLMTG